MENSPDKEQLFNQLIEEHSRLINRICYFYSTQKHTYEDLRQEVFISIWKGLEKFRGESKISTFIYRIAVNSVLMVLRSNDMKISTLPLDLGSVELSSSFDDEQKERLEYMYQLIQTLEKIDRAIILLWLDEKSYQEIAEIVGMTKNLVAIRIHRIKKKLSKLS